MYKDYIKKLENETLFVNQDDDLVIMELKWLGLYDMFTEFIDRVRDAEPTAEGKAMAARMDRRTDQISLELGLKPAEGPPGRMASLGAYVEPYNRIFVFAYYWKYSNPVDNGYSSYNLMASEENIELVGEQHGLQKFLLVKGPLPVYKSYYHAARKLKGRLHKQTHIANYDTFDKFLSDWRQMYNK